MRLNPCRECGREPTRISPSAVGEFKIACECGNQETFLQAPSAFRDRNLAALSEGDKEISDRWNRNNKQSVGRTDIAVTMSWQPIETAPKNEMVLIYFGPCYDPINVGALLTADDLDGKFFWHSRDCRVLGVNPTHWMPLPAPPSDP